MRRAASRRLAPDVRGVTVVEFALVLVPFMVLLGGTLELGYATYVQSVMQGALQVAARDAALGNQTPSEIDERVKATLNPLVRSANYANCDAAPAGTVPLVCTTVRSFTNYSGVGKDEKLVTDKNGNGKYDSGDCWRDANDNGKYDYAATAGRDSTGNADDVVYSVKVAYRRIMPMASFLGWSANNTIESSTMLHNQPFAKPVPVSVVCG